MTLRHEAGRIFQEKFGVLPKEGESSELMDLEQLNIDKHAEAVAEKELRRRQIGELASKGVLYVSSDQSHDLPGLLESRSVTSEQEQHSN